MNYFFVLFVVAKPIIETPEHLKGTAFDVMRVEFKHCGAVPYAVTVYEGNKEEDKKAAVARFWNRRTMVNGC